jgi:transcriptional regulator with XRE-family HTH domain
MKFGERLSKIRKEEKQSQQQVGDKAGVKREYLCKIETGILSNPSLKTIKRIAKAFDISLSELFVGVD